jgi:hypothetical protein
MKNKICPIMSCRTTKVDDPSKTPMTMTPTIIRCQEGDCAVWFNEQCGLIQGGGNGRKKKN